MSTLTCSFQNFMCDLVVHGFKADTDTVLSIDCGSHTERCMVTGQTEDGVILTAITTGLWTTIADWAKVTKPIMRIPTPDATTSVELAAA